MAFFLKKPLHIIKYKNFFLVCFLFSEANCELLANLFHSLDIWHKSIKLTAKITAVCISVTCSAVNTCLQGYKLCCGNFRTYCFTGK